MPHQSYKTLLEEKQNSANSQMLKEQSKIYLLSRQRTSSPHIPDSLARCPPPRQAAPRGAVAVLALALSAAPSSAVGGAQDPAWSALEHWKLLSAGHEGLMPLNETGMGDSVGWWHWTDPGAQELSHTTGRAFPFWPDYFSCRYFPFQNNIWAENQSSFAQG